MSRRAERMDEFYRTWRFNIFAFCEVFNFEPTEQQKSVLRALQCGFPLAEGQAPYKCEPGCHGDPITGGPHRLIAVKSGKGPGKTTLAGIGAGWRTLQHLDAMTVVTAPTMRQCKEIWLKEFKRQLRNAHPILQKVVIPTTTQVHVGKRPEWGVVLITASKEENAQGYHEENMSVIAEEASGIPREIITAFKGTLTNANALFLLIGNPNQRDCAFFDCFNSQRAQWKCITLNAEETPKSAWFDPIRNRLIADEFGEDSDVYKVTVKGEFPSKDPNTVISSDELEACTRTDPYEIAFLLRDGAESEDPPAKQFGIDLARFGSDESVIYRRTGNAIVETARFSKTDPNDVIDHAFRMQAEAGWRNQECWYVVDAGGMGQGVMRRFYDAQKNLVEFHSQGKSSNQQYANKVTEAWFLVSRKAKLKQLHMPDDPRLIQQLSSRQYYINKDGKLIVESKEEYKDRMSKVLEEGASPDRADAFVMANYDAVVAAGHVSGKVAARKTIGLRTQ